MVVKESFGLFLVFLAFGFEAVAGNPQVRDTLDLDKSFVDSPADLLRGKVSGVRVSSYDGNINGADNVVIRGISSIHAGMDSQPLWIVDGVEINNAIQQNLDAFWQYGESSYTAPAGQLAFLNAYDIESIEVLKDISATSVYGSKGASGVIIVRTKKPVAGEPVVKWTSNIGVGVPEFSSEYFAPGISHNHTVAVNGSNGKNLFGVSAFYRDMKGVVNGTGSKYGGARFNFDAVSNKVVRFGISASVSMGRMSNVSGSAYLGQSSFILSLRDANAFPDASAEGWRWDYDDDIDDLRTLAHAYLDIDFGHGLKWSNNVCVDLQDDKRYIWYGRQTPFGREWDNAASIIGSFVFREKFNSTLEYQRYFGKHFLKAGIGFEQTAQSTSFNTTNGVEFFNANLRAKGLNMHRDMARLRKLRGELNQLSPLLAIDYSWNSIVGICANARPDFMPHFLDKPVWYYSASAYVDIRKAFFPKSAAVSGLSLRGGYGTAGKASHMPYIGEPVIESGAEPYFEGLDRLYASEASIALETSFLEGRLDFSLDLYSKNTDDIYSMHCFGTKKSDLWTYSDRSDVFERVSTISNKGVELDLSAKAVRTREVLWTISANVSINRNEMTAVCPEDRWGGVIGSSTVANINSEGLPAGSFYGFDTRYGEFGALADGLSPSAIYGGLSSTLKFYGFTFDVAADGTAGRSLLNLGKLVAEQKVPYTISEKYVEKADFLRLGRVSLAYDINVRKIKWMRGLRVFVSAYNLLTLSSYSGWNPDVDTFGFAGSKTGIDYGSFPQNRTVTAGFNVSF